MKKPSVNKDLCISCGACVSIVPDVFAFDEDDKAFVREDSILDSLEEDVVDAVEGCPTGAILLDDNHEK